MKYRIKHIYIYTFLNVLFLFSIFLCFSCKENPLLPSLNTQIEKETSKQNISSTNKFSIYNLETEFIKDENNYSSNGEDLDPISLKDILNPDYAWCGVLNENKVLFVFDKDKFDNTLVYFASVSGINISVTSYKDLYENMTLLPTVIKESADKKYLTIGINPIFFIPQYENFMNNDFTFNNRPKKYNTNIKPAEYSLIRGDNKGDLLRSYMTAEDLREVISKNSVWHSTDYKIKYKFFHNGSISTNAIDIAKNEAWDIWSYNGYDETSSTNYIYIFDNKYLYIKNNRKINNGNNVYGKSDVMFFFNEVGKEDNSLPYFIRLSTKP